ncbi:hypothetical protein E5288_WYG017934 [Bos mutus]|uniref:Threonine aspartase 1 n=1 Tax=Bos mutus TaxID=72004 RepID=A0A6B0RVU8_9CETA|nr:hypothetical protein [Bos mutus]
MTTRFSLAAFKRNKRKLELAERVETDFIQLKKRRQSSEKENDSGPLDTVGAVVVDHEGNVAAAVSSGGLALKHPGRVGQAALYGCGCWAENTGAHNPYSTAVSTSGCGEHLVRTILARECSHALQAEDAHQALLETMQNKFISSPFLASEDGVLGGVIVLRSCWCSAEPNSSQNKQTLLETAVAYDVYLALKYLNYKAAKLGSLFSKGHDLFYTFENANMLPIRDEKPNSPPTSSVDSSRVYYGKT